MPGPDAHGPLAAGREIAAPVIPGRVLGARYELIKPIARGGMAEVWEGRDATLRRSVAVKVLLTHLASDSTFVERFRREAVTAARVAHPCVVATFDAGVDAGTPYIVMELVQGQTLRQLLTASAPLDPGLAVAIALQIADALANAHRAGLVHRDIKPGNILLCDDGDSLRVKVTDFGIAKVGAELGTDLTQTGMVLGTPKYLSPEQVEGRTDPDARSDLYALGVVLFEMLTGRPPFNGPSDMATALSHLNEQAPRVAALRPGINPGLDSLVAGLLAKSPGDRPPTAVAARQALDVLAHQGVRNRAGPNTSGHNTSGHNGAGHNSSGHNGSRPNGAGAHNGSGAPVGPGPNGSGQNGSGQNGSGGDARGARRFGSREARPAALDGAVGHEPWRRSTPSGPSGPGARTPPTPQIGTRFGRNGSSGTSSGPAPSGAAANGGPAYGAPAYGAPAYGTPANGAQSGSAFTGSADAPPTDRTVAGGVLPSAGPSPRTMSPLPGTGLPGSGLPGSGLPGTTSPGQPPAHTPPPGKPSPGTGPPPAPVSRSPAPAPRSRPGRRHRASRIPGLVVAVIVLAAVIVAATLIADHGGANHSGTSRRPRSGAPDTLIPIVGVKVWMNVTGHAEDNPGETRFVFDGNPATTWNTDDYGSPAFGGLYSGEGLAIHLNGSHTLHTLTVSSPTVGWAASAYVAAQEPVFGSPTDSWGTPTDSRTDIHAKVTLSLGGHRGEWVLLWLTDLGPGARASISEVTVH